MSQKGTPCDNVVAESTLKSIKTEFVYPNTFESLNQLEAKLSAYV
ncbi:integrase core domain-containing protein [Erysipelothrix rhusiopathiae]|nr:integrase core domain-containing protein [Erysipelothrix rhusiopathiae]MDE8166352.1 integrase core domain-containing protein [Erysipelothrix rhusiopathiae]